MSPAPRSGRWRRPPAALFVLALGVSAYFFQAGGWNQNARLALVRSIVGHGTVRIDGYEQSTRDLAFRDGHYYCDKAPGLSWLAVPAYAAVQAFSAPRGEDARTISRGAYVATVWAVALPSALAVAVLYTTVQRMGLAPPWAAALSLAYAFGTLALPYSTLFYGHQLAAALLFLGFALLVLARDRETGAWRALLVGLLLGCAVAVEYTSVLALAAILAFAVLSLAPRRRLLHLAVGLLVPGLALAGYHQAAFGSPLRPAYAFSTGVPRHQGIAFGLRPPGLDVAYQVTFSAFRGLFHSAPWLLLAIPGAVVLVRTRRWRREALTCVAIGALYLALNASLVDWDGGWAIGPRHSIPALPFLVLLAAGVARRAEGGPGRVGVRALLALAAAGALYSVAAMVMATAVRPEVPVWIGRPLEDDVVPRFRAGDLAVNTTPVYGLATSARKEAWNAGQLAGLQGLASLLPLALGALAGLAWVAVTVRADGRRAPGRVGSPPDP